MAKARNDSRTNNSSFRNVFDLAKNLKGPNPQWPCLLIEIIRQTFETEKSKDQQYEGEVFKDRTKASSSSPKKDTEPVKIKGLYRHYHDSNDVLKIGEDLYWLISYEVPNQGGNEQKKRRIDLLALRPNGALAIFEAKLGSNSDTPIAALLEALDYTACLMRQKNLDKLKKGFDRWGKKRPVQFESTKPNFDVKPEIILLGEKEYFDTHARSPRSKGWIELFKVFRKGPESDRLPFLFKIAEWQSNELCAKWYNV